MSTSLTIQQAASQLGDLVRTLAPGDEILLTDNNRTVALIVPQNEPDTSPPKFGLGSWIGKLEIVDEDDDGDAEILEMFEDYLP